MYEQIMLSKDLASFDRIKRLALFDNERFLENPIEEGEMMCNYDSNYGGTLNNTNHDLEYPRVERSVPTVFNTFENI